MSQKHFHFEKKVYALYAKSDVWYPKGINVFVIPNTAERARVGLAPLPGTKGTDYINASYIMVRDSKLLCYLQTCKILHHHAYFFKC